MSLYSIAYANQGLLRQASEIIIDAVHISHDDIVAIVNDSVDALSAITPILITLYDIDLVDAERLIKFGYKTVRILSADKQLSTNDHVERFTLDDFYDYVPVVGYSAINLMEMILVSVYPDYLPANRDINMETAKDLFAGITARKLTLRGAFDSILGSWKGFEIEESLRADGRFYRAISAKLSYLTLDLDKRVVIAPIDFYDGDYDYLLVSRMLPSGIILVGSCDKDLMEKFLISREVIYDMNAEGSEMNISVSYTEFEKMITP